MRANEVLCVVVGFAVAVAAFEPGTLMWTQLSNKVWYNVFSGRDVSTFTTVPIEFNCANCWGYSAVDSTNQIYYTLIPNDFRAGNWTLIGVKYSSMPPSVVSKCTFSPVSGRNMYSQYPYGVVASADGSLFALLHATSSATGVFLAKLNAQTCAWAPVSETSPSIGFVPLRGSFQPSNLHIYKDMIVFAAVDQGIIVGVSVDLATGKLIQTFPLPSGMRSNLPIINFGLDETTGKGYVQTSAFGSFNQWAVIDFTGQSQPLFFNNTNFRSLATGMLVDSRSAIEGQAGPNFVDTVAGTMSFWSSRVNTTTNSVRFVMTAYIQGGKRDYPTTAALYGYRYDEKFHLSSSVTKRF